MLKEINTHETFHHDTETNTWRTTGKYQKAVLYQAFHAPSITSGARRGSLLDNSDLVVAKTSKEAFTEKMREANPAFQGRKHTMLRLRGRKTSITTLQEDQVDDMFADEDEELYSAIKSTEPSPWVVTPQAVKVKTALERSREMSKRSAKFHYCWHGYKKAIPTNSPTKRNPNIKKRRTFDFDEAEAGR
jgi:hypothetical protein